MKICQKINLQEPQRNRNATTNFVNLIRTSTVHGVSPGSKLFAYETLVANDKIRVNILSGLSGSSTVESRYLKLGYLEFCEVRSVYLNQKHILIAFDNRNLALGTFLQVQIT